MNSTNNRACLGVAAACAFLLGLSLAAIGAVPSSSLQATNVLADVRVQGAQAVVATLWANNEQWNEMIANIGRGEPGWLEVAAALHPGTDAGAAETLDEAVFLALKPAPIAVLQLLKEHQFDTDFVCSSNIGTDYTPEKARRFIRDRISVLMNLSESRIFTVRNQCLTDLRAALKEFPDSSKKRGK